MSVFEDISQSLQKGRAKLVVQYVTQAIGEGHPAQEILDKGLIEGMNIIGVKFKNNEVYVPEVMIAARAMNAGTEILKPLLASSGAKSVGRVCLGTVKGDMHDIGKNLVKIMMEGKGIEVIDLGTDVSPQKFLETAVNEHCGVVACSALLTTTMGVMGEVVETFKGAGQRQNIKIMIGGAPVTQQFCDEIGADSYTPDAASASEVAVNFLTN
jgi:methylmalonyl-CoA mutase cobalamin-binding domain/chain